MTEDQRTIPLGLGSDLAWLKETRAQAMAQAEFRGVELVSAAVELHAASGHSGNLARCPEPSCDRYFRALDVTPEQALDRKRQAESSPSMGSVNR